jgi:hypothetical protein
MMRILTIVAFMFTIIACTLAAPAAGTNVMPHYIRLGSCNDELVCVGLAVDSLHVDTLESRCGSTAHRRGNGVVGIDFAGGC